MEKSRFIGFLVTTNDADLFTKEDNDVQHFESLRNLIVTPRETFGINFTNHAPDTTNNRVHFVVSTMVHILVRNMILNVFLVLLLVVANLLMV